MNRRIIVAIMLFVLGLAIWIPSGDVIKLIINNQEVLLGRYSRGQFGALFVITLILWIAAATLFFLRKKPISESIFSLLLIYLSTGLSIFVLVIVTGFLTKPRYVEQEVAGVDADTGIPLGGIIRHRPPNEHFDLIQKDTPENFRSYPDSPAGYPEFPVILTTDANGFRNQKLCSACDIEIIGDSFVAGSHVSDDQVWTEIVRKRTGMSLYNLGVSGSDPLTYLNNFVTLGRALKPKKVIVTIYEGNDFRDAPSLPQPNADEKPEAISRKQAGYRMSISDMAKASPVTAGLRRFATEVLAKIGHYNPVPGYKQAVGFMPLALNTVKGTQHYSFDPKRVVYLDTTKEDFLKSSDWINVRAVLEKFVELSKRDGFSLVFVYAPSAPHVVMPLLKDQIPADQLVNFVRYRNRKLDVDDAEKYKKQLFDNLDSEESVMMDWCVNNNVDCISVTDALRRAAKDGRQVYYTYDQHWTPEGNAVVADVLTRFLSEVKQ